MWNKTFVCMLGALLAAPLAAADTQVCDGAEGVARACVEEVQFGNTDDTSCPENDTYYVAYDSVTVWGPKDLVVVGASGWTQCSRSEGGFGLGYMAGHGFSVGIYAPESHATFGWSEMDQASSWGEGWHDCFVWAAVFVANERGGTIIDCNGVADPPNPGWGTLLP